MSRRTARLNTQPRRETNDRLITRPAWPATPAATRRKERFAEAVFLKNFGRRQGAGPDAPRWQSESAEHGRRIKPVSFCFPRSRAPPGCPSKERPKSGGATTGYRLLSLRDEENRRPDDIPPPTRCCRPAPGFAALRRDRLPLHSKSHPFLNNSFPSPTSAVITSPSLKLPSSTSRLSGSSKCLWMARFKGRAPYTGSYP